MTYLITGSNGQLGRELSRLLPHAVRADRHTLDITDADAVQRFVDERRITHIINCAAYTAVDRAEQEPEEAARLNSEAPGHLAATGAALIHISTDYVFDGRGHRPYKPSDPPAPLSVYGQTKRAGERTALEKAATAIIIRTAWLYSARSGNFVSTMRRLGAERETLNVVADQIGSPTFAGDLAQAIVAILPQIAPGQKSIYHYTNEGVASWYDLACAVIEESGLRCRINPIPTSAYPTPAPRPYYSVLSKESIKRDFNLTIPHWTTSLRQCIRQY